MFSAIGTVAITLIGSPRRAASTVVAITAAAPLMSEVMWCMLVAGLIEMPPVSNVMPLPTRATVLASLRFGAPRYAIRTSRGGRDDPLPTPTTPPYPRLASAFSSSTSTSGPALWAKASAREANSAGNRRLGGELKKSRAGDTSVAIAAARPAAQIKRAQAGHHGLRLVQGSSRHPGRAADLVGRPIVAGSAQPDRQHGRHRQRRYDDPVHLVGSAGHADRPQGIFDRGAGVAVQVGFGSHHGCLVVLGRHRHDQHGWCRFAPRQRRTNGDRRRLIADFCAHGQSPYRSPFPCNSYAFTGASKPLRVNASWAVAA